MGAAEVGWPVRGVDLFSWHGSIISIGSVRVTFCIEGWLGCSSPHFHWIALLGVVFFWVVFFFGFAFWFQAETFSNILGLGLVLDLGFGLIFCCFLFFFFAFCFLLFTYGLIWYRDIPCLCTGRGRFENADRIVALVSLSLSLGMFTFWYVYDADWSRGYIPIWVCVYWTRVDIVHIVLLWCYDAMMSLQ